MHIVLSWGSKVVVFNVDKHLLCLLVQSLCPIWWTVLLCHALQSYLMCRFEHMESKYGHVPSVWFVHGVQFGFRCMVRQIIFVWFSMYVLGIIDGIRGLV